MLFNNFSSHQYLVCDSQETIEHFTGYHTVYSPHLSSAYLFLRCTLRLSWQSAALCCFCCCACLLVLLQLLLLPRAVVVRSTFSLSLSPTQQSISLPMPRRECSFFLPIPLFYSCCCSCFSFVLLFLTRLHPFPLRPSTHPAAI